MSENNTSNDAANGTNNKNATGTNFTRFADYFVICGLDFESGLEPDILAGKIRLFFLINNNNNS